ncbi:hypothetical protein V8B97DRAFT_1983104 [Scleroderma yunnanense]
MDLGLEGVHVLVTGASGGIGAETARLFCSLGANVTAHYNSKLGPIEELSKTFPNNIQPVQGDLTQETVVQDMFTTISQSKFGPVQVAIINHGVAPSADAPLVSMTLERWNYVLSTNLTSSFLVCREYLKGLVNADPALKDKASIVLIGSTSGKFGSANHSEYAVTKSAMMYGLTLSLKNEIVKIAPKGRVNCVAPGFVRTAMSEASIRDPQKIYTALATTPLKKVATPLDVANQIVVMASSTVSGHVSGQVLMIEGGMEGRLLNKPEDIVHEP